MDKYTDEELDLIQLQWLLEVGIDVDDLRTQRAHIHAASVVPKEVLEADPDMAKIVLEFSDYIAQRPHKDLLNPEVTGQ
jgi:hypothetical protein